MTPIKVNYPDGTITISSAFAKKAFTPGTVEYTQLMRVRNDFPDFRLATREFKTNTKQDRYKGLTYPFMREHITKVEGKEAPAVLAGFEALIDISKCHSTGRRYATVKSWFLKRYPDVATFGMNENELAKWNEKQEQENAQGTDNITDFSSAKEGKTHSTRKAEETPAIENEAPPKKEEKPA